MKATLISSTVEVTSNDEGYITNVSVTDIVQFEFEGTFFAIKYPAPRKDTNDYPNYCDLIFGGAVKKAVDVCRKQKPTVTQLKIQEIDVDPSIFELQHGVDTAT